MKRIFAAISKVVPVYRKLLRSYPSFKKLSKANLASLEKLIHPLGLKYRAKILINLAKIFSESFNGRKLLTSAELLSLPGVGEYIANAMLCFRFNENIEVIDSNVIRIYERILNLKFEGNYTKRANLIKPHAKKVAAFGNAINVNYALLDLSAAICLPKDPKCYKCPINLKCKFYRKS